MKNKLLANLKAIDPDTARWGICSLATKGMWLDDETDAEIWLKRAFKEWPEFSGVVTYPVPCPNRPPVSAYNCLARWSKHTKYGRARRRLLKFLIRRLEDELR